MFDVRCSPSQRGSVLIIVLWITLGLVGITLYFANSMSFELRASDNRVSGLATEQAVDGAARYLTYVLANLATNGTRPDPSLYQREAVSVGGAHFWLIGQDTNDPPTHADQVFFGLVDEASKVNLNTASTAMLDMLPRMTTDLSDNIVLWRSTNADLSLGGAGSEMYSMLSPPYQCKSAPFETIDELRLVYSVDLPLLAGEDANRNGVLDPNEIDEDRNGKVDPGLLSYTTVYSREPNTRSDGSPRVNVRNLTTANSGALRTLLQTNFTVARANQILSSLNLTTGTPGGGGGGGGPGALTSPLHFYAYSHARNGLTAEEFAVIEDAITTSAGTTGFIEGRINVNTANAAVLACLPGMTNRAVDLVNYRMSNPDKLNSVAWVLDALSLQGNEATQVARQIGDRLTTRSYQFTADVAAVGPHGRGYRRVRFVFDTSEGTPKILYRRELTHLGWALGKNVRDTWLAKNKPSGT